MAGFSISKKKKERPMAWHVKPRSMFTRFLISEKVNSNQARFSGIPAGRLDMLLDASLPMGPKELCRSRR